jgi:SprT-like family
MPVSYRAAAAALWGDAGIYAHEAYEEFRPRLYRELPRQVPIVIGITAYGHCAGLTRCDWRNGPRISLSSSAFGRGACYVDDVLAHEMLHAWLFVTGRKTSHDSADWYQGIRSRSLAVLGREIDVRRGADRRSVRVPNPAYEAGGDEPKTLVRKEAVRDVVQHAEVAGWPHSFRPDDYDWGEPIDCPSY